MIFSRLEFFTIFGRKSKKRISKNLPIKTGLVLNNETNIKERRGNFIINLKFILKDKKKKKDKFNFFSEYKLKKKKICYLLIESFKFKRFPKNFFYQDNILLSFFIFSIKESQIYFYHFRQIFPKKNPFLNSKNNNKLNEGWIGQILKSFNDSCFKILMKQNKNFIPFPDFSLKKVKILSPKNFFKKKNFFFIKTRSWNYKYALLINLDLSKISANNKKFFLIKILEISSFLDFQKIFVVAILERTKYDTARLLTYMNIFTTFLKFNGNNRSDKYCEKYFKEYQNKEAYKIKNKENIFWAEARIDLMKKHYINKKNLFFLISKRKKEISMENHFHLVFCSGPLFFKYYIKIYFQNYISHFFKNQNQNNSWFLELPLEFFRTSKAVETTKFLNIKIIKIFRGKIFHSHLQIFSKRSIFFLKELIRLSDLKE